jgi:hypothetical protein
MVDVAVSRMMGLVVVARLANRHNVKVELRQSQERGTVADVMLPAGVLVPRALAGRTQAPAGFPASRATPSPVPQRPIFPAPLALEGSSAGPSMPPLAPSAAGWSPEAPPPGLFASSYQQPPPSSPHVPPLTSGAGLGAALADHGFGSSGMPANGGNGSSGGRLPAWHDLTGATDRPAPRGWDPDPSDGDPLPLRRPNTAWPDDPADGPAIPRQMPSSPEARTGYPDLGTGGFGAPTMPPAPYLPPSPVPEHGSFGTGIPAPARPPVWPPVTDEGGAEVPGWGSSPDFTAEMPAVRSDSDAVPAPPSRYSDDLTMELPIFRELESAWFRVGQTDPEVPANGDGAPAPVGANATADTSVSSAPPSQGGGKPRPTAGMTSDSATMAGVTMSTGTPWPAGTGGSASASGPGGEVMWRTVADDGWTAAQAAMQPVDGGTTEIGLPKRVPMAQLVPGGVEPPSGGSQRRTPDSVRGLLSAYTRGVQRGRGAHGSQGDSEASPGEAGGHGGSDSSREQEA